MLSVTDPDDHAITYSYDADNEVDGRDLGQPLRRHAARRFRLHL